MFWRDIRAVFTAGSAADFRNAVAAGVDELADFPGNGHGVIKSPELFQITAEGDAIGQPGR